MSQAWWDWPLTQLPNHCPAVLWWHCWLGHLACKIDPKMTYNVSSGMLNPTIPYHLQCGAKYRSRWLLFLSLWQASSTVLQMSQWSTAFAPRFCSRNVWIQSLCSSRDVWDRFFYFGSVSVRFLKNSDSVRSEFGSVWFKKTLFGWGIIVICYSCNSWVVNVQQILRWHWMTWLWCHWRHSQQLDNVITF